ncbi:MAG: hypothetical protein A2992_03100 [Elusimicrobia bacterium RIFCSPLOWO2_01_FULL_59_12]|nr:MAG: hypothetical protein A2992_03100 [Elusimicrobia bacterium RIFCSPLOWO2_01_FULL_59_12]
MDTLAHGLWGGAVFGQREKGRWTWAFLLGMAPDLLSFGPFFLTRLGTIAERWGTRQRMEPPDPSIIPAYVYDAYDVTHSLVMWGLAGGLIWAFRRKWLWVWGAWALHILCDIPTHSTRFFPTPFLWPLDTPFVNGARWAAPGFMLANYSLLALTYLAIVLYKSKRNKA